MDIKLNKLYFAKLQTLFFTGLLFVMYIYLSQLD